MIFKPLGKCAGSGHSFSMHISGFNSVAILILPGRASKKGTH
jgi:hypothetical protein